MALLTAQQKSKKIPISLRFDESLLTQIKSYNEWVGIEVRHESALPLVAESATGKV